MLRHPGITGWKVGQPGQQVQHPVQSLPMQPQPMQPPIQPQPVSPAPQQSAVPGPSWKRSTDCAHTQRAEIVAGCLQYVYIYR